MGKGLVAKATTTINTPLAKVWDALTKPEIIKQYMFGTNFVSDWKVGSSIVSRVVNERFGALPHWNFTLVDCWQALAGFLAPCIARPFWFDRIAPKG